MIGLAIDNALRGLQASSRRSEVASRNIAGATTEGYNRKEASYSSGPLGLRFKGIVRVEDPWLASSTRGEQAALSGNEALLTARTAFTERLGDPRDDTDLSAAVNRLAQAFQRLSDRPEDATVQQDLLSKASAVALKLNTLSNEAQAQRLQADGRIASEVELVNDRLEQVHLLNQRIGALPQGADRTELMDERERAINEVAQRLPVRVVPGANDKVTLITDQGVTLVADEVTRLSFTPVAGMAPEMTYGSGALSGLAAGTLDITPSSGASQAPSRGLFAGLFAVRDAAMPEAQAQLDEFAKVLAQAFEAADPSTTAPAASVDPSAPPAPRSGLFVDRSAATAPVATVTGLAARLTINAEVNPSEGGDLWRLRTGVYAAGQGEPGEATQARAFAAVFDTPQSFDPSVGLGTSKRLANYAGEFTSFQGNATARLSADAEYQRSLVTTLTARLGDERGVDMDKELQDALLFEKTYSASATVLQVAGRMLDELLAAV